MRSSNNVSTSVKCTCFPTCPSHLFHPSQKPWNFASPPDTLSGMHKIIEIFADRAALHTEILALRQQVAVLKRKRPRPSLRKADRVFWVTLSYPWPGWCHALVIVRPETVIGWHRKGFRLFWTWKSRRGKPSRPPVSRETRALVRRMSRENTYLIGPDIGLMMAASPGPGWPREKTCQQFGVAESYWDALSLASPPPHLGPSLHPPDASRKRSAAPPCTIATAKSVRRTQSAKPPFTTSMASSVRHRPSAIRVPPINSVRRRNPGLSG